MVVCVVLDQCVYYFFDCCVEQVVFLFGFFDECGIGGCECYVVDFLVLFYQCYYFVFCQMGGECVVVDGLEYVNYGGFFVCC